jgi:predicted transcriptional regulator of viral defense system
MTLLAIFCIIADNVYLCIEKKCHMNDTRHKIKDAFYKKDKFTLDEVISLFSKEEPFVSRNALVILLNRLIKERKLLRIGKGIYSFQIKNNYRPFISKDIIELWKMITEKFPYGSFCIWSTKIFNEFMVHQSSNFYTIIESEKENAEFVFNFLKENKYEAFLNPSEEVTNLYTIFSENTVIIKNLITESPLLITDKISTISIEKLLVDVFCEPSLFSSQQGSELDNIFKEANNKYAINEAKLNRYAKRRNRKDEICNYLKELGL